MTPAHLDALSRLVGPAGLTLRDVRGRLSATVAPADTPQCAAVLRWCHETRTPLGLGMHEADGADDAVAAPQLSLRTDRMTRLRALSASEGRLVAESGASLAALQAAAGAHGLRLPPALGRPGARTLGEALHAQAWGRAVIGLEVVLPDGRVWQGAADPTHSATSFALGALFFAGVGALGVVTAVNLHLEPADAEDGREQTDTAPAMPDTQIEDAELLARIKRAFDPNHLLNPGRLV